LARVGAAQPGQRLPVLARHHVDRHHDDGAASAFGTLDQRVAHGAVVGGVELEPDRPAARGDRILDRCRRHGGEHLQMIAGSRRACHGDLAPVVKGLVAAGGRDRDRAVVARAEQLDAHVDAADIDQAARPQLQFLETVAVGAHGRVVVDAGRHVADMRRRRRLVHRRFDVEDIDRLCGIGDDRIGPRRALTERPGGSQQRACCHEPQEMAAAGDRIHTRNHRYLPIIFPFPGGGRITAPLATAYGDDGPWLADRHGRWCRASPRRTAGR
jgi:hypothetical protein